MALDFSVLQGMDPAGAFFRGQEAAQAEQERNMLRQQQAEQMQFQRENMLAQREMQRENMLAQREQRLATASEREAAAQERAARVARQREADEYLTRVSDVFAQNNMPLTPETAQQGLAFALRSGDKNAVEMMSKTVQAMQERASYEQERQRLGLGAPGAAVGREQVQNMLMSSNPQIVTQGKALAGMLEKPRASQLLTPEEEAQKTRVALASRPPVQPREPREPSAPVAVVDEATGRVKYVSREEAIGKTPAAQIEGLTPKERQKREALFPKAKQAVATVETTMGDLVADLENLAAHPGLTGITGVVYGRTPSVTPQAREAQALYDKIVARGGFSELQNMRAASPTGGALGNVSNQEGAQLKQAFAEIGREQATESVRKALLRAAENAKLVRQRAREAFEDTYEYRQGGGPAPAAGALSPAEQAELEQLRKRFGKGG
jgi:hypothetical protein